MDLIHMDKSIIEKSSVMHEKQENKKKMKPRFQTEKPTKPTLHLLNI